MILNVNLSAAETLRQKAEELLKNKKAIPGFHLSEYDALKLFHEFEVQQVELELQNDELLKTKEAATEAALAASQELYADLVANQSTGIYRILVGKQESGKSILESISIEFASDRFRELFEIEFAGIIKDISAAIFQKIHPDDLPGFIESNEVAQHLQQPYIWEGRLLINNCIKWVRFESRPRKLENGSTRWTGVAFDFTKRKQAEQALRESEEKYRFLAENISDVIWTYNLTQEKFTYISPSVFQLRGFTDAEAMNENVNTAFTPESAREMIAEIAIRINEFQNGIRKTYLDQLQQYCKDGSIKWIETASKYKFLKDGSIEVNGVSRDISKRKQAEVEINLKNEELQKINAEKDKYFSIIAHDLRNPFSGFLGLTELMVDGLKGMTEEEIQDIALLMRNSATNLFRLLGNLLEWSRMQRGLTSFVPESFLLMPKIIESMGMVQDAANKKKIAVTYVVPGDLIVFADENMVGSLLRNLVSNAVKFTLKGGNITVRAKTISFGFVEISIKDTGIGMNKKLIDNLFRLDVNTNRKGTEGEYSTGLGLIICKDFIEKHGGKLWIESEEGRGSTFYFTLPANPATVGKSK